MIKTKIIGFKEAHIIIRSDLPKILAAVNSPSSARLPRATKTPIKQMYDRKSYSE